jgi:hypothetical protein
VVKGSNSATIALPLSVADDGSGAIMPFAVTAPTHASNGGALRPPAVREGGDASAGVADAIRDA